MGNALSSRRDSQLDRRLQQLDIKIAKLQELELQKDRRWWKDACDKVKAGNYSSLLLDEFITT
jgi:hypothetical protein